MFFKREAIVMFLWGAIPIGILLLILAIEIIISNFELGLGPGFISLTFYLVLPVALIIFVIYLFKRRSKKNIL
jgi:uncharacterized membrane protein YGL010W